MRGSHHTVALHVVRRDAGVAAGQRPPADRLMDAYRDKLGEWVAASKGHIRADRAHGKLVGLGYGGSERTPAGRSPTPSRRGRRATGGCAAVDPEPGLWFQYDHGAGPGVAGAATVLFCAWLAWSRLRFCARSATRPSRSPDQEPH